MSLYCSFLFLLFFLVLLPLLPYNKCATILKRQEVRTWQVSNQTISNLNSFVLCRMQVILIQRLRNFGKFSILRPES
nr:MAG TPA: hypothetical protein [Caudoviricetes sp.]